MIEYTNISVSEGSVTEPVSLVEAKAWLNVDFDDHDSLLTDMIKGARSSIEKLLNLALVAKSVTMDVQVTGNDSLTIVPFPYTMSFATDPLIKGLDSEDAETDLVKGTDFFVRGNNIRIASGRFSVSYTTVPVVPEDVKEAIKMEVANRYKHRGENNSDSTGISQEAKEKAEPYSIPWL